MGSTLRQYDKYPLLGSNTLKQCNSFKDLTVYPMYYGYVPEIMLIQLDYYIMTILGVLNERYPHRTHDFLEGELEILMMELWYLCSTDMQKIDEKKLYVHLCFMWYK